MESKENHHEKTMGDELCFPKKGLTLFPLQAILKKQESKKIVSIDLSGNDFLYQSMSLLISFIDKCENLKLLNIEDNFVSNDLIKNFETALSKKSALKYVNLNNTGLNDSKLPLIINSLMKLPIKELHLKNNSLGNSSIDALASLVEKNNTLNYLDLSGCRHEPFQNTKVSKKLIKKIKEKGLSINAIIKSIQDKKELTINFSDVSLCKDDTDKIRTDPYLSKKILLGDKKPKPPHQNSHQKTKNDSSILKVTTSDTSKKSTQLTQHAEKDLKITIKSDKEFLAFPKKFTVENFN